MPAGLPAGAGGDGAVHGAAPGGPHEGGRPDGGELPGGRSPGPGVPVGRALRAGGVHGGGGRHPSGGAGPSPGGGRSWRPGPPPLPGTPLGLPDEVTWTCPGLPDGQERPLLSWPLHGGEGGERRCSRTPLEAWREAFIRLRRIGCTWPLDKQVASDFSGRGRIPPLDGSPDPPSRTSVVARWAPRQVLKPYSGAPPWGITLALSVEGPEGHRPVEGHHPCDLRALIRAEEFTWGGEGRLPVGEIIPAHEIC